MCSTAKLLLNTKACGCHVVQLNVWDCSLVLTIAQWQKMDPVCLWSSKIPIVFHWYVMRSHLGVAAFMEWHGVRGSAMAYICSRYWCAPLNYSAFFMHFFNAMPMLCMYKLELQSRNAITGIKRLIAIKFVWNYFVVRHLDVIQINK